MVAPKTAKRRETATQGHVAIFARDARWRRAAASRLTEAGHSQCVAGSPEELRRLLVSQRFDVLAMKMRDELDAQEIAAALQGVDLPPHGILAGSVSALPLIVGRASGGTFRFVPGRLPPRELSRLVEASISAGARDDAAGDAATAARFEEVDLEETIERAAAAVYPQAKRRRQRFSTLVEGPDLHAYADPAMLRRSLAELLGLVVTLAPRGALVAVEARAADDEWTVRIRAAGGQSRARGATQPAVALRDETRTLTSLARAIHAQGGMLWVELIGPAAIALCLTLPRPPEARIGASA